MRYIPGMETALPDVGARLARRTSAPSGSLVRAKLRVRSGLYYSDGDIPNLVTARSTRVVEGIPMVQKLYTD